MRRSALRTAVLPALGISFMLGVLSVWTASPVYACSCVPHPPPEEALESSEEVFSGEVVNITQIESSRDLSVSFDVSEVWKGVDHRELEVATPPDSAACGFEFQEGEEYLVYTLENQVAEGPETVTGLCQRTALLADAGEDLDALGAGTPGSELSDVESNDVDSGRDDSTGMEPWLLGGGGALVGILLMIFRLLRG